MALIFGVLIAVALGAAAVWGLGTFLPVKHVVARSARFRRPPADLWALVSAPAAYPAWRTDVREVEVLPPVEGRAVWREIGRNGRLTFETVTSTPERRLVTRIVGANLPFGGTWTLDLAPEEGGTRLTIREDGEIRSPAFRFLAQYVFGHDRAINAYLRAAAMKYNEAIRIEAVPTWG